MSKVDQKARERIAYWKKIGLDAARAAGGNLDDIAYLEKCDWKDENDLFAYFALFQPDGAGVERVFEGVVGSDEISQRVRRIYQLKETATAFGYFVVRQPELATDVRLIELSTQHLLKVREIAREFDEELARDLEPLPEIKIRREQILDETHRSFEVPETRIYSVTGDWFADLKPRESDALLFHEAFYSIACDYKIAHYLMWPLYRNSTKIEDPFAPYFELWMLGALPFFEKPGLVNVYVPPPQSNGGTKEGN